MEDDAAAATAESATQQQQHQATDESTPAPVITLKIGYSGADYANAL